MALPINHQGKRIKTLALSPWGGLVLVCLLDSKAVVA